MCGDEWITPTPAQKGQMNDPLLRGIGVVGPLGLAGAGEKRPRANSILGKGKLKAAMGWGRGALPPAPPLIPKRIHFWLFLLFPRSVVGGLWSSPLRFIIHMGHGIGSLFCFSND